MLVDSHCHLDFDVFDIDRTAILAHCQQLGITQIIIPGVTAKRWGKLISITDDAPQLHPALGLHPMFMSAHQPADINLLETYVQRFTPIAIGEIGLDFYIPGHDKNSQTALFEQQLNIAKNADLPVILHVRKAHDATIQLLKKHRVKGGIVHAFNGSEQQAQLYIQLGFLLGVGGTITYEKSTRLRRLFSQLPLSALALETDAPDMPLQGQTDAYNSPEAIATILDCLSTLRPEDKKTIAETTTRNVSQLFNLSPMP